jgi:alpha-amylase
MTHAPHPDARDTAPSAAGAQGAEPLRLVFGLHLHQPVGNFDHVFEEHARDVYRPLVEQLARRRLGPTLLHISGPLLEWLEQHDAPLVDRIGRLAADGRLEFLLGGMYEPILAAIPRADRVQQVAWLREALLARFGVAGDGLWLTERVWEPDLAFDLALAGVRFVFVDDRHFLVTGFERDALHVPYRTESEGRGVTVLAIDQRLRYLIPFRPPEEIAEYLRGLHTAGRRLAVFADDGEKLGGWPGTREWVYGRGWFDRFCDMLESLQDEGTVRIAGATAIQAVPSGGLVYLPTASYREMEAWALPASAAVRLAQLEADLGADRVAGPDGALVRGSHWRNFLVKYSEANRLHKKMLALSALCSRMGDPPAARRAIARAQCNDALWHGVFGGLYLPHLRAALWRQLALAEGELRRGEALAAEVVDFDADGDDEIWIHSSRFSAIVAPAKGGAIVELTRFDTAVNHADVLTRRLEAYHLANARQAEAAGTQGGTHDATQAATHDGTPSIHELEAGLAVERPPVDLDDRAIGVARVVPGDLAVDAYAAAQYVPCTSWARTRCAATVERGAGTVVVRCASGGFAVEWSFAMDGTIAASYRWDAGECPAGSRLAVELSVAHAPHVDAAAALDTWRYGIETVARSERGVDRVRQGESVTLLFDARRGEAAFSVRPSAPSPG